MRTLTELNRGISFPKPKEQEVAERRELVGLATIILSSVLAAASISAANNEEPVHLKATPIQTLFHQK